MAVDIRPGNRRAARKRRPWLRPGGRGISPPSRRYAAFDAAESIIGRLPRL